MNYQQEILVSNGNERQVSNWLATNGYPRPDFAARRDHLRRK